MIKSKYTLQNFLILSLIIALSLLTAITFGGNSIITTSLLNTKFDKTFNDIYQPVLDSTIRARGKGYKTILFLAEKHADRTKKPILIVETGSIRDRELSMADDGASTFIFSHFAKEKNGWVYTVDLDPKAKFIITNDLKLPNVKAFTQDSISFLKSFPNPQDISILYLDSYDVNFLFPEPAALHHLNEIKQIFDKLNPGTIIIVDDNLIVNGKPTGKGYMVEAFLKQNGVPLIYDGYQKVFQIKPFKKDLDELQNILKA